MALANVLLWVGMAEPIAMVNGLWHSPGLTKVRLAARRVCRLDLAGRPGIAGVAAVVILAGGLAWLIEARLTELLLAQVAVRATDQVELVVLPSVTAADFEPPHTEAELDGLRHRLDPLLARARQQGSGVIRLNLFARDGTIIYSDLASLRGQVVAPSRKPLLAGALAGSLGTKISHLSGAENADLKARHDSALEAYVPFVLDGRVVGVFEFHQDVAPLRPIRLLVLGGFALLGLASLAVVQRTAIYFRDQRATPGPGARPAGETGVPPGRAAALSRATVRHGIVAWNDLSGLTRREREVLALLAHGLTNRQIAAELVISERTVETHVSHILSKLRLGNRAQLLAWVLQEGLVVRGP